MLDRLAKLFGGGASARGVAKALGKQMGVAPTTAGGSQRLVGAWKGGRCQIVLDAENDRMTVGAGTSCRDPSWEIRWTDGDEDLTFVSPHVALTSIDAERFEALPLKTRVHVIDVVEAGHGSIRLERGTFTLQVRPAGLARPNAAEQAAIRLDVMVELAAAAGAAFSRVR